MSSDVNIQSGETHGIADLVGTVNVPGYIGGHSTVSFSHTNRFTVLGTNPHQDGDERIDDNPNHLLASSDNSIQHGLTTSDTTVPTAAATNTTSNCNSSDVVLNGGSNSSPQQHNGGADNNSTQNTANGFTFTINSALFPQH